MNDRAPHENVRWSLVGAVGLVVIVIGSFLPWLRSGRTSRNSYQTGGEVRRLIGAGRLVDDLLGLWPVIAVACAGAVALFLIGSRTLAAVLAGLSAIAAGAAAIVALAATATSLAKVALPGPVVTLIGATLVALAVLLRAFAAVALPRSPR